MKNKIKNFLFKKRVKILRNNKGLSLIEIMVALGLIGILAAVAVPQFQSYQRDVKYGVLKSMAEVPFRTIEIEGSLGRQASSLSQGFLWSRVKSKDKGKFTPTFDSSGSDWCFLIKGNSGDDYEGFEACINQTGTMRIGGSNVPCSQAKASRKEKLNAQGQSLSPIACDHNPCPNDCKIKTGQTLLGCAAGVNDEKDCEAGNKEVYTDNLTCASGACGP